MKRKFKYYAAAWAVLLVIFNAVAFLAASNLPQFESGLGARFWVIWCAVIIAFVGNLVCAYFALRSENSTALFYNIPLITLSRGCVIVLLIIGGAAGLIPGCPAWAAAVLCVFILGFNAVTVIKANAAAEMVAETGAKVKTKTAFIRTITVDAENLLSDARTDEAKTACRKVYEALRYSDPMSSESLAEIESEISKSFEAFSAKIKAGEACSDLADELVNLIGDRNRKCKVMK